MQSLSNPQTLSSSPDATYHSALYDNVTQQKRTLLLLLFSVFTLIFAIFQAQIAYAQNSAPYSLITPPGLINFSGGPGDEFSGSTYYDGAIDSIFVVGDNAAIIYEYNLNGTYKRAINISSIIGSGSDLESISWMHNNLFVVGNEQNGMLYVINIPPGSANITISSAIDSIDTNIIEEGNQFGIEGVAYDQASPSTAEQFYVLDQKDSTGNPRIYHIQAAASSGFTLLGSFNIQGNPVAFGSDIYHSAAEQALYVASSDEDNVSNNVVLKLSLTGSVLWTHDISNFLKPEGLTFTPDLSEMIVVGEPRQYARYSLNVPAVDIASPDDQLTTAGQAVSLAMTTIAGSPTNFTANGLPPGLSINPTTGTIGGTPTTSGTYNVSVTASNGSSSSDSEGFMWTITNAYVAINIANPDDQSAAAGQAVSLAMITIAGSPTNFAANGLPPGLSINPTTGTISGTPTTSGTYTVLVTASDGSSSDSEGFLWAITNAYVAINITNPDDQLTTAGEAVSLAMTTIAGSPTNFAANGLPPGLSINPATGAISGTPTTSGTYTVLVTASDGSSSDSEGFLWTITGGGDPPESLVVSVSSGSDDAEENLNSGAVTLTSTDLDLGVDGGFVYKTGIIFRNVNVPQGAQIVSAVIEFTGDEVNNTASDITIKGIAESNASTFIAATNNVTNRATIGNQNWTNVPSFVVAGKYQTPDLSGIVEQIMDLDNWVSGNAIGFTIDGTDQRAADSFEGEVAPKLIIEYLIAENHAPVLTNPGEQLCQLNQPCTIDLAAIDLDNDGLTFSATGLANGFSIDAATGTISGTPTNDMLITVTASANDGELDALPVIFTIDINSPPFFAQPLNRIDTIGDMISHDLGITDADGDSLTYLLSDQIPGLTFNNGLFTGQTTLPVDLTMSVTATDGRGGSTTREFDWTVLALVNDPPIVIQPADLFCQLAEYCDMQVEASDEDEDALIYAATGMPDGMTIDSTTGLLSGAPNEGGLYTISISVSDNHNAAVMVSIPLVVNRAPIYHQPPNRLLVLNSTLNIPIGATDVDGDQLMYSAIGLPPGLSIDSATGVVTGVASTAGAYSATVSVDDGNIASPLSHTFTWYVHTIANPGTQLCQLEESCIIDMMATELNLDTLVFNATGLATGLSINPATGQISGVPTQDGVYSVAVWAVTGIHAPMFLSFDLEVNSPPELAPIADHSSTVGDNVNLALTASDPDNDSCTIIASALPTGLSIDSSGLITGQPTAQGNYPVVVTVADDRGGSTTRSFLWTVTGAINTNTPPMIKPIEAQKGSVGDKVKFLLTAKDADGDQIHFAVENLPAGLKLNSKTGVIQGQLLKSASWGVMVTAADGQGGTDAVKFEWFVAPSRLFPDGDVESAINQEQQPLFLPFITH